jgi:hypothetical protein
VEPVLDRARVLAKVEFVEVETEVGAFGVERGCLVTVGALGVDVGNWLGEEKMPGWGREQVQASVRRLLVGLLVYIR